MLRVYRLALYDFSNSRLGSSCAALMEMLGRDSTPLRIDLQCANRIAKYSDEKQLKGTYCLVFCVFGRIVTTYI